MMEFIRTMENHPEHTNRNCGRRHFVVNYEHEVWGDPELNLAEDLLRQRQEMEMERSLLQQQILDMEQMMNTIYAHILRQRKKSYERSPDEDELLEVSARNDRLIARYYALTERIGDLDVRIRETKG
jgi:hypothetical protein